MKKLLVIAISTVAIISIFVSKLYWDKKIEAYAVGDLSLLSSKVVNTSLASRSVLNIEEIMKLTTNLPKEVAERIESNVRENETIHLLILGSQSTPKNGGWPGYLKDKIEEAYGEDVFNVTINEIQNKTTKEIIDEGIYRDVVSLTPDILLLEPFILYDNGKVKLEDRLDNITYLIEQIQEKNPNLLLMIQPANPLYNAKFYPGEVESLKEYAEINSYIYIDHWVAWPDQRSEDMKEYLTSEGLPNEKGHEAWGSFLENLFISNE